MPVAWVLLDLNGTLLDPSCLAQELEGEREDRALVEHAFDEAILHAMADTLSGAYRPLPDYLRAALERSLAAAGRATDRVESAMQRAKEMDPFPDARPAMERLRAAGLGLAVVSNSSADAAREAIQSAGLADGASAVIGSDAVRVFKPHPEIYSHALRQLELRPEQACMLAAHSWDIAGAHRVGLRTAWIARNEAPFPAVFPPPDIEAPTLLDAAAAITERLTG